MVEPRDTKRPDADAKRRSVTGDLAARIARAQSARPVDPDAPQQGRGDMTGMGRAFRLASEFVAAILLGLGLGWAADQLFGTTPWGTIILLLLGFAAGVLNVIRATAEMNAATAVAPDTPALKDDDDE